MRRRSVVLIGVLFLLACGIVAGAIVLEPGERVVTTQVGAFPQAVAVDETRQRVLVLSGSGLPSAGSQSAPPDPSVAILDTRRAARLSLQEVGDPDQSPATQQPVALVADERTGRTFVATVDSHGPPLYAAVTVTVTQPPTIYPNKGASSTRTYWRSTKRRGTSWSSTAWISGRAPRAASACWTRGPARPCSACASPTRSPCSR